MKYLRRWPCAVCGESVIYDSEKDTIECTCGVVEKAVQSGSLSIDALNTKNFRVLGMETCSRKTAAAEDPENRAAKVEALEFQDHDFRQDDAEQEMRGEPRA